MSQSRILRVAQSNALDERPALLEIRYKNADALDFEIFGTESTCAYAASFREKDIQGLRSPKYKGEKEEWAAVVAWTLLGQLRSPAFETFVNSVEMVADIRAGHSIKLIIRQRVSSITSVLGSLSLEETDRELDVFEWTNTAVQSAETANNQVAHLRAELKAKDDAIDKLRAQLDDLITAKKAHEDQLLTKAMHLINSKKLKIRDQQRLLSTATVDRDAATRVASARKGADGAGPARSAKRKAASAPKEEDESSDEGFEAMKAEPSDQQGIHPDMESEDGAQQTPEATDEDTDDGGGDLDAPPSGSQRGSETAVSQPHAKSSAGESAEYAPPPRSLPFASRKAPPAKKPVEPADDDETTDDEL